MEVPSADNAAINKATPARISGDVIWIPRKGYFLSSPITFARCGSHNIIWAPISINLSTKKSLLSNIFWCINTEPFA